MENLHRILIVEDRVQTAEHLRAAIEKSSKLSVCGIAYDVDAGLRLLAEKKPRILLTDLGLPDGSGVEVIRAARAADWECDSLVFTVFGDEKRALEAFRAGAKGYILKDEPALEMSRKIHDVIKGDSPMSPKIARILLSMTIPDRLSGSDNTQIDDLTKRELDVLNLISKGFKRQEVADKLNISIGTVGTHIHKIYGKLGVHSNIEAVTAAVSRQLL